MIKATITYKDFMYSILFSNGKRKDVDNLVEVDAILWGIRFALPECVSLKVIDKTKNKEFAVWTEEN